MEQGRWQGIVEWNLGGKKPLNVLKLNGNGMWQKCCDIVTLYFRAIVFGNFFCFVTCMLHGWFLGYHLVIFHHEKMMIQIVKDTWTKHLQISIWNKLDFNFLLHPFSFKYKKIWKIEGQVLDIFVVVMIWILRCRALPVMINKKKFLCFHMVFNNSSLFMSMLNSI